MRLNASTGPSAKERPSRRLLLLPALAVAIGLAASVLGTAALTANERARLLERFRFDASQRAALVAESLSGAVEAVDAIGRFFEHSAEVNEDEFLSFTKPWLSPSRFEVLMVLTSGGEVGSAPAYGGLSLRYSAVADGSDWDAGAVARLLEQLGRAELAPLEGVASAPRGMIVTPTPRMAAGPIWMLWRPIRTAGGEPRSGVVALGFVDVADSIERAIASTRPQGLPTRLYDEADPSGLPFYSYAPRIGVALPPDHPLGGASYERRISFADAHWIIEIRPSTALVEGQARTPLIVMLAGTVTSLALGLLVLGLVRDTSLAKAKAAAVADEFERFFTMSLDLFAIAGTDGRFKRLNAEWEATLGYPVSELEGRMFMDFVHPEDVEATKKTVERLSEGGEVANFTNRYRARDGSYRFIEWRSRTGAGGRTIYAAARDISERMALEEAMRRTISEKESLIKEVHHRVKNNMQVISSLLDLESLRFSDPAFAEAAKEAQGRIRSMAMVHEQLYRQEGLSAVDLGIYLRELVARVVDEYPDGVMALSIDAESVLLDLDTAIPCGLAINELLTNAFKYAGNGRPASVSVTAGLGSGLCAILVEDDGPGLPAGSLERSLGGATLGLSLVSGLAQQLGGELAVLPGAGARFEMRFPYPREGAETLRSARAGG